MLHARNCVLCGHDNLFYDNTMTVDPQNDAIVRDMLAQLHHFKMKGGKAPSFNNVSPRQEIPELYIPNPVSLDQPKEKPNRSSNRPKESARKPANSEESKNLIVT